MLKTGCCVTRRESDRLQRVCHPRPKITVVKDQIAIDERKNPMYSFQLHNQVYKTVKRDQLYVQGPVVAVIMSVYSQLR